MDGRTAEGHRSVETVVVGAGQAGLIMSHLLQKAGREHVVLERRTVLGGGWLDRWDAFQLVSPNWTTSVPGYDYAGDDPDGFMTRNELVAHFRGYAAAIAAPVELDTDVTRLSVVDAAGARFRLTTSHGTIEARDVVVAGGPFQTPFIPAAASGFDQSVLQLHSHDYRNPEQLPPGGVLLIGSGQSGVQLAEELRDAGRSVTLSIGRCGRAPRRYRGRDLFWWLRQLGTRGSEVGAPLPSVATLSDPRMRFACNPHLSGHGGGHETNLRRMATEGIRVVGRFERAEGSRARFAPDLGTSLAAADGFFEQRLRPLFDLFAERTGESFPAGDVEQFAYDPPEVAELDLAREGISTVLWTSGYRPAFGWIELPIFDELGLPRQTRGVTEVPGLTFIGLPWMHDMGSANLVGLARDAEHLARLWDPVSV